MRIRRLLESDLAKSLQDSDKIHVIYGARQTGKTTLSLDALAQLPYRYLHANADESRIREVLSKNHLPSLREFIGKHELLFIDEAQRIKDIGLNLKLLHDSMPALKLLVTGSSSLDLASEIEESLTGRKKTFQLFPIAQCELDTFSPFELNDKLPTRLIWGSYPEILTTVDQNERRTLLHELTDSYLYRDILSLADIRSPDKIRDLLKLLAFQIGSTVSHSELGTKLGLDQATISRYIDLLEKSFVIYKLTGFSRNLRKEVTKTNKYFFYDLGIRNALINNLNDLSNRNDQGQLWENFLIMERLKYQSYHNVHFTPYFWRTYTGAEIDYIEERDGNLHGYEIKYGPKKTKAPKSWQQTYTDATWQLINQENWLSHVSKNTVS